MKNSKHFTKNSFRKEVGQFLSYLHDIRGYSDSTITAYQIALEKSCDFIEYEYRDTLTILNIMPYRVLIASQGKKTIAKKLSILRSFTHYLKDVHYHVKLISDTSIKVPASLPKPIEYIHIEEVLKEANTLDRLMLLFIYGLGLRISELANLSPKHFDKQWVRVEGKGKKTRDIPILPSIHEELTTYLKTAAIKTYIFEKNGEKLSENTLRYRFKKLFYKIGIKATPHQLRHSFATDLLNDGSRITDVSTLLGHAHLSTTQIYTKLNSGVKMQNYIQAHPLCRSSE